MVLNVSRNPATSGHMMTPGRAPCLGATKNASALPSGVATVTILLVTVMDLDGDGPCWWDAAGSGQPVISAASVAPAPSATSRRLSLLRKWTSFSASVASSHMFSFPWDLVPRIARKVAHKLAVLVHGQGGSGTKLPQHKA